MKSHMYKIMQNGECEMKRETRRQGLTIVKENGNNRRQWRVSLLVRARKGKKVGRRTRDGEKGV